MTKMTNCRYRMIMTGTLDGSKTHKLVLEGLFGVIGCTNDRFNREKTTSKV